MVHHTTILAVRREGKSAIGGDGQVTLGETAVKHDANKIRRLADGKVLIGFAGSAADGVALMERFEGKLSAHRNVRRAAIELAKDWRTDRVLRRLESLMIVVAEDALLIISGQGDVIEPNDGVAGIGSGGMFAVAAAKALLAHTDLDARSVVEAALSIAAEICVFTNRNLVVEEL
jgi:ATP-dependent HslUV protease subunit HslV